MFEHFIKSFNPNLPNPNQDGEKTEDVLQKLGGMMQEENKEKDTLKTNVDELNESLEVEEKCRCYCSFSKGTIC